MKKCISCGKELEDNALICPQCGAKFGDIADEKIKENTPEPKPNEEPKKKENVKEPQVKPVAQNTQPQQNQQSASRQPQQNQQPVSQQPQQRPPQQNQQPVSQQPQQRPPQQNQQPVSQQPQQRPPQQRPMPQNQQPVQRMQQPQPMPQQPVKQLQEKPVSTAGFFLTMFLFAIPVIGWIACIVMGFTAKNSNRRNFARAWLIWLAIILLLAVVAFAWYSIWGKDSIGLSFRFEDRTFAF